jgi:hypothetical protein
MRPGVTTFSHAADAAFAAVTGSADASYPVANLGDLVLPSKVARVTPSGGVIAVTAVLPAAQAIQAVVLGRHTLPAGATVRLRLYSDAAMTTGVAGGDSGVSAIPAPVAGYRQCRPFVMAAAQSVRAVRVDIASAGSSPVDLGWLEIAGWWNWGRLTPTADIGQAAQAPSTPLLGGGERGRRSAWATTYAGQVAFIEDGLTAGLDFQKNRNLGRPFVFVEDADDPATWPRTAFLAVNKDLAPLTAQLYRRDTFQIRVREHCR